MISTKEIKRLCGKEIIFSFVNSNNATVITAKCNDETYVSKLHDADTNMEMFLSLFFRRASRQFK